MLYPIIPANIMIEFCKKYQLDAFDKAKLHEYSPEYATANDDVDAKKWAEIYKDLKEQSLAWDEKLKKKDFECPTEQTTTKFNPIASLEPTDETVRKAMYNQYIHWSSAVSVDGSLIGGGISRFLQVSLGQINPEKNMFERTIYKY